jgi:hypothetical protein
MRRNRFRLGSLVALALALSCGVAARPASAQSKNKARTTAAKKSTKKSPKKTDPDTPPPDADASDASDAKADVEKPEKGEPSTVKAAGTTAATKPGTGPTAAVKENKEGVKTFKFGTIEVEGRLKSPQIIYFMRRVRAEFDAGLLGHRSFLRELSDTRNNPSFR